MNDKIKATQAMTLARAINLINEQERRIAELEAEKAAVPAAAGNALADELPPLPKPHEPTFYVGGGLFKADQMHDYGRACMAIGRGSAVRDYVKEGVAGAEPMLAIEMMLADYHREVWEAAQSDTPDYDYAGRETAKKLVRAIEQHLRAAPQAAPTQDLVRFCPHCGLIGDVGDEYRDCCPDGNGAFMVPPKFAEQCRATFRLCLETATEPQAAQGEGLTIDTPQFRVLLSSVSWETRTAPSDAFDAALNRLIAHIDQAIAAHLSAAGQGNKDAQYWAVSRDGAWPQFVPSQADAEKLAAPLIRQGDKVEVFGLCRQSSKDSERLDWMIHRGAHIAHTMDGEMCNVWLPARRDGTEARPAEGYPQKRYGDGRAAIDAAMKAGAQGRMKPGK